MDSEKGFDLPVDAAVVRACSNFEPLVRALDLLMKEAEAQRWCMAEGETPALQNARRVLAEALKDRV